MFLIEYVGPILIHSLCFLLPSLIYPQHSITPHHHTYTVKVAYALVLFHYLKRELETVLVHRFSSDTMPIRNIFKNSFHYWFTGGIMIAYFLYHPLYTPLHSPMTVNLCALLFIIAELSNAKCHLILRDLRPAGTRVRGVPRGFLFDYVTCANYTTELAAWLVFAFMINTLTGWLWIAFCLVLLMQWSYKRHVALRKEFGEKAPRRKILIPFVW